MTYTKAPTVSELESALKQSPFSIIPELIRNEEGLDFAELIELIQERFDELNAVEPRPVKPIAPDPSKAKPQTIAKYLTKLKVWETTNDAYSAMILIHQRGRIEARRLIKERIDRASGLFLTTERREKLKIFVNSLLLDYDSELQFIKYYEIMKGIGEAIK